MRDAIRAVLLSVALSAAAPFGAALATPLDFDFSYTGTGVTASGVLITNGVLSGGAYTVTGITGTRNSVAITGLVSFFGNDDLLFPTAPFVDNAGISYAAGGIDYNFFESGSSGCPGVLEFSSTNPNNVCGVPIPVSLTVTAASTAVPEPASLALLGSALVGFGVIRRRRRKAS